MLTMTGVDVRFNKGIALRVGANAGFVTLSGNQIHHNGQALHLASQGYTITGNSVFANTNESVITGRTRRGPAVTPCHLVLFYVCSRYEGPQDSDTVE